MTGGSISAANKIAGGYAAPLGATGVAAAGARGWRNFGRGSRSARPIAGIEAGSSEMAENCGSCAAAGASVARLASHGQVKAKRSQAVERQRRLIAGYAARDLGQLRAGRPGTRSRGAASPFGSSAVATRVASASRQIQRNQAQVGPDQCLKLRSSQSLPIDTNGSGPGAVRSTPKNGVRGAGERLAGETRAETRSAGRRDGAEAGFFSGLRHAARAPFVSEGGKATPRRASVNEPVQSSVDNAK